MHVDHCALHIYSEFGQSFHHVQSVGLDEAFIQATRSLRLVGSGAGLAARTASLVVTEDLQGLPSWVGLQPHLSRPGFKSVWVTPLFSETRLLGALTAFSPQPNEPGHHERYLSLYAGQVISNLIDSLMVDELHSVEVALGKYHSGVPYASLRQSVRADVLDGWERSRVSLLANGIEVTTNFSATTLTETQLEHARQSQLTLLRAVRHHFTEVTNHLLDRSFALLICNADGWVIDVLGDAAIISQLGDAGLGMGANVSERAIGNSGIGSPLVTRRTTYFNGYEHYNPPLHAWSSVGAPVFLDDPMHPVGAFALFSKQADGEPWHGPLIESARVAITSWMEHEESLQTTLRIHHSILSHLDYHVVCIDPTNRVIEERHPIPLTENVQSAMIHLTQLGECDQSELPIGNGTFLVDVRNLWDHSGHLKGRLGLFQDVTKRKQMEQRAHEADKFSMLTSLTAGIAHEIRNPLTTAKGFLQLFADRLTGETDRQFLHLTITELDRINKLVNDFMSMAKPDTWGYEKVNITELVDSVSRFIGPEATLLKVPLDISIPAHDIWIWADGDQIKQVILNIVQNALQACEAKTGAVTLELAETDHHVEIIVSDTGCGMTEAQIDRMFQPFYTTKATGTGLGMSISKRIVEEHGGKIKVTSQVEVGTTVCIELKRFEANSEPPYPLGSTHPLTNKTLTH